MGKAERCGVRVVARFRPLSKSEIERGDAEKKPFRINNKAVVDHESYTLRQYVLDQIVPEATQQEQVRGNADELNLPENSTRSIRLLPVKPSRKCSKAIM